MHAKLEKICPYVLVMWTDRNAPADRHHHGVIFGLLEMASVLQSLQHSLPRFEPFHTLRKRGEVGREKQRGSYQTDTTQNNKEEKEEE